MRLQTKVLTATALVFLAHFLSVEYFNHQQVKQDVIGAVQDDARIVRGMLMSLRDVYQQQFLDHDVPVNDQTLGFLPAHSISRISRRFREWIDTGLSFNNVSDTPWNPGNMADAIEREAIDFFRRNEQEKERLVPFVNERNEPFYHFAQPIWVKARCLKCHGAPEDAPPSIQRRYPGAPQYELGELRGVMSIKLPASVIEQRVASLTRQNVVSHSAGFLVTFLVLSLLLRQTVLHRIDRLNETAKELAKGNYRARTSLTGDDELAHVARTFDGMAEQISRREKALTMQRSLLKALSETNKSIIRLDSRQALFEKACAIVTEYGGLKAAWIGLVDTENGHIVPAASAGQVTNCLQKTRFLLDPQHPLGKGPVSTAIRERRAVIVSNLLHDVTTQPWRKLAADEGMGAAAVFPISCADEVIGAFSLYAGEQGYFNEEIIALLDEMTSDITFALNNHRLTEKHELAHRQLEKSTAETQRLHRQLSLLLESTGEGIFGVDDSGRCIFVNRAALQVLGFQRGELIGENMHRLTHHSRSDGTSYHDHACPVNNAFRTGDSCRVADEVFWRKDGTSFPVEYSSYPIQENETISGSVTIFRDVSETRAMAKKMSFLATHDTLTKLLNRYAFEQQLVAALDEARGNADMQFAMCYMDLDQFKVVNDTCGHIAGDAMLQMVAHLIQKTVRQDDVLARLGGDEFALLLRGCSLQQGEHLGQKICEVLKDFRFSWQGKGFATGISIGVVCIDSESESAHSILSAADSACYVAKELGRNRVFVQAGQDGEVARRQGEMQWVAEIHAAIEEQRLFLHYQPIVTLKPDGREKTHFELLLRMKDRDGQYIPPGAFIPAAERYDLMPEIDRWVIRNAFAWLARHPEVTRQISFCAINLSGQSLADERLHEYIVGESQRSSLAADKICFEITETAAVGRLDQAATFVDRLKRIGFRFALDDFGTGMSSFAYLKTLPVDYLKIDGSFVKDIVSDPIDRAMVASINEIGHLMGIETIAEYVENDAIKDVLIDLQVDYAQGFGIARPQPLDSLLQADRQAAAS